LFTGTGLRVPVFDPVCRLFNKTENHTTKNKNKSEQQEVIHRYIYWWKNETSDKMTERKKNIKKLVLMIVAICYQHLKNLYFLFHLYFLFLFRFYFYFLFLFYSFLIELELEEEDKHLILIFAFLPIQILFELVQVID